MATIARLIVSLEADIKVFVKDMNKAGRQVERSARQMESIGRNLTTGVTLPLLGVGAAAVKMAVDAQESEQFFAIAMGGMAEQARAFSEGMRAQLGLNAIEIRKSVGTLQLMFTTMGIGEQSAYQMATGLTRLSYDMAALRGVKPEEAFQALEQGMLGATRGLKGLGLVVDDAVTKAEALRLGIIRPGQQMSAQQEVIARYAALIRLTAKDHGELARSQGEAEAQMWAQKAAIEQATVALGTALLPAYQKLLGFTRSLIAQISSAVAWFRSLSAGQQATIITIAGLAAAIGPLLLVMGKLARLVAALPRLLALVTSTAGATVAIVAILAFAAVTFIRNWDVVKIQFVALWAAMKNAVFESISFILGLLGKLPLVGGKFRDLQATLDAFAEESLAKSGRGLAVLEQQLSSSGAAAAKTVPPMEDLAAGIAGLAGAAAGMGTTDLPAKIAEIQAELRKALGEAGAGFSLFDASAIQTMAAQMDAYKQAAMDLINAGLSPQSAQVQVLLGQYNLLAAAIADANAQQERMNSLQQFATQVIAQTQTPLQGYVAYVQQLTAAFAAGYLSQQQFQAALQGAYATYDESTRRVFDLGAALENAIAQGIGGAAEAIGGLLAGLKGGLKGLLNSIMGLLGNVMKTLGQSLIAFGVAGDAIKKFIHNPFLAIAAGAALMALGSTLASSAQRTIETGGAAMAAGGGGGGGSAAVTTMGGGGGGMATGPTIVELPPGRRIYDWSDPAQVAEFQAFWDTLVGRRVIFVQGA